jgi:hypothetical protein
VYRMAAFLFSGRRGCAEVHLVDSTFKLSIVLVTGPFDPP